MIDQENNSGEPDKKSRAKKNKHTRVAKKSQKDTYAQQYRAHAHGLALGNVAFGTTHGGYYGPMQHIHAMLRGVMVRRRGRDEDDEDDDEDEDDGDGEAEAADDKKTQ